jgi:hypothetical protein
MKAFSWLLGALLTCYCLPLKAQEFTQAIKGNDVRVSIQLNRSEVSIEAHNDNQLRIEALDYQAPPKKAEGLRPLHSGGPDNTGFGLMVQQDGNEVVIREVHNQSGEYKIFLPKNAKLSVAKSNWGGGDLRIVGMQEEIELSLTNGDVLLDQVRGPVIANSTSGNMTVRFSSLSDRPSMISLVSGDVEISMPESSKATFDLKSISGEIYTNLDLRYGNDKDKEGMMRMGGGQAIKAMLNGGGAELNIKTISGNMYLRKN